MRIVPSFNSVEHLIVYEFFSKVFGRVKKVTLFFYSATLHNDLQVIGKVL